MAGAATVEEAKQRATNSFLFESLRQPPVQASDAPRFTYRGCHGYFKTYRLLRALAVIKRRCSASFYLISGIRVLPNMLSCTNRLDFLILSR